MSRIIVDIHVLQTVPPSNMNRDDTGTPKTAVYGGVRRARVSSQAWKRATRRTFADLLDPAELGVRTKKVVEAVADRICELEPSLKDADVLGAAAEVIRVATRSKIDIPKRKADAAKNGDGEPAPESSYLMFLSFRQLDGLARLAVEGMRGSGDIKSFLTDKGNKARAVGLVNARHSVDIALFGRMVADSSDINVDAATQVAHAISVHAVDNESDYYTAVDDLNTDAETGAGMIGTVDFNSATLYRYAALDVDLLSRNLGAGLRDGEPAATPVRRAVEAFVEGFITSMPTGKINTFGNHTLPAVVIVKLRMSRPINFVCAFEKPVAVEPDGGHLRGACKRLADHIPTIEGAYSAEKGTSTWVMRLGPDTQSLAALGAAVALDELVAGVGAAVADRLEPRG